MWLWGLIVAVVVVNAAGAMITVLRQPREISATWGWLLVLLLLPVVGFGLYWLFGRKLPTRKLNALATQQRLGIDQMVATQQEAIAAGQALVAQAQAAGVPELVRALLQADGALITTLNACQLIAQRETFMTRVFADLAAATNHIHLEAYTIEPDATGRRLLALLTAKAQAGVRVRVIYDPFGSHRLSQKFWRPLILSGGLVEPFIATRFGRADPRINFRNHRKLVVIDGRIGYMGGFDFGHSPKHPPIQHDTELRLEGQAVAVLQARFFMDWNTTAQIKKVHFQADYFPPAADTGTTTLQIVSGGPEQPLEAIKLGYLRLVGMAKRRIWIQSPYFVPDDSLIDALAIAVNAGVDVRIMVPRRTNQPMMARATRFYLDRLVQVGAQIYYYNDDFLHNKTIIVDDQYLAMGTANLDIRSFRLNFEIAAFVYDADLAAQATALFTRDLAHATHYTHAMAKRKPRRVRLGEELSRLLTPIL
ncbi:cardiolipin synthase [Lacticaseibacillus daqingensis]|uniref:cardiolipin synthase n=1 Tax=Lacticaseibacillus daqingensis TaxID=2486014 RepID=UPI000F76EF0B|nr:cardiolipin synthase [Lacticaseibacillus daqingensis]